MPESRTIESAGVPAPDEIPTIPSEQVAPPFWARVDAEKEDRKWSDLDEVKLTNDRRWLKVYGWLLVVVTVVFALVFLGSFVVWAIHNLTSLCWLSPHQLEKIQSVLFSGGMGAIVTSIVRTQIGKAQ